MYRGQLTRNATNAVNNIVDQFLANGVVTTGIVVGRIFPSTDEVFGVEKRAVATRTDFVHRLITIISTVYCQLFLSSWIGTRTDGSRSTKMERGTYLPLLVSLKKVS